MATKQVFCWVSQKQKHEAKHFTVIACEFSILRWARWVKFSADDIVKYLSHFPRKKGFDFSCKLDTICMKYQILFSGEKNKKKYDQFVVCWFSLASG